MLWLLMLWTYVYSCFVQSRAVRLSMEQNMNMVKANSLSCVCKVSPHTTHTSMVLVQAVQLVQLPGICGHVVILEAFLGIIHIFCERRCGTVHCVCSPTIHLFSSISSLRQDAASVKVWAPAELHDPRYAAPKFVLRGMCQE